MIPPTAMQRSLWTGPADGPVLVLAHGAGAAMDSEWMSAVADLLGDRGIRTVRFEFGYMAARRNGRRPPAPRADRLEPEYRDAILAVTEAAGAPVAIGGKSMGGRIASMIADDERAAGRVDRLVCLGYPFHPAGRPDRVRTGHLARLATPTLIVQGTRDPLGTREDVAAYDLSPRIRMLWLEDGDHGFRPRVRVSGITPAEHLATAADAVAGFLRTLPSAPDSRQPKRPPT